VAPGRSDAEPRHEREKVEIVRVDDVQDAARGAVRRGGERTRPPEERTGRPSRKSAKLAEELTDHVGASTAPKLGIRLADAGRAFEAERYLDAKRILAGLVKRAPGSAAVRELNGLTLYRLGKWEAAIKELEAFRALTGSTEQNPVLADSYRALRRWDAVESLWNELREASPSAELVAEGRIVYAGSLADRDDVPAAIAVIEPATRRIRSAREHHLRLLYVLGDLYERAGEVPRARAAFDRVVAADPGFGDATARRRALS
jgi:tetratricopeptide (TPR) repeat protein